MKSRSKALVVMALVGALLLAACGGTQPPATWDAAVWDEAVWQ